MESLSLTEAHALSEFVEDPTGNSALSIFLGNQREYHEHRCTELMYTGKVDEALEAAHFAKAYETMLPELKHFVTNQIRQIA